MQTNFTTKQFLLSLLAIPIASCAQLFAFLIGNLIVLIGLPLAIGNAITGILYTSLALLGISFLCKKILKISLAEYKISKPSLKPIWIVSAFIMPLLLCIVLLLTPGKWHNVPKSVSDISAILAGGILFFGVAAGTVEEVVFRGIIMTALERKWNKRVAIIAPSILFGLVHIFGRQLDFLSILQLLLAGTLVGILFSLVTYESGSIWCSAFMHSIWNMVMVGNILHISISSDAPGIFNYELGLSSRLITGGDFGIEASIFAIIIYFLFSILALVLLKKKNK